MKKFLVLAALVLGVFGLATQAGAAPAVAIHTAETPLVFRKHLVQAGDRDCYGGYIDSVVASGIAKFDTTLGVSTAGWTKAPSGGALNDSTEHLAINIYESQMYATVTLGKTSATAESIYIKVQVSPDMCSWADLPVLDSHAPVLNAWTAQTTVNAAVVTFVKSTNTGISNKYWRLTFGSGLYCNADAILLSPYVRFIISGTRTDTNHSLKASISHWSANEELQR